MTCSEDSIVQYVNYSHTTMDSQAGNMYNVVVVHEYRIYGPCFATKLEYIQLLVYSDRIVHATSYILKHHCASPLRSKGTRGLFHSLCRASGHPLSQGPTLTRPHCLHCKRAKINVIAKQYK